MKRLLSRIVFSILFCFGLLISFLMNPSFAYSNSVEYKNVTIYYNGNLNEDLREIIDISLNTISQAEIYDNTYSADLCLNEGIYPKVVKGILGDDVFTAFSNKIVVLGNPTAYNRFEKWNRELKYSQFLSHAMLHNLQYNYHGFWDANPLGNYPNWKWEGYVEYEVLGDLVAFEALLKMIENPSVSEFDWISITEEEGTIKRHVQYLVMVKYCFEVLDMDYEQFMQSEMTKDELIELIKSDFSM